MVVFEEANNPGPFCLLQKDAGFGINLVESRRSKPSGFQPIITIVTREKFIFMDAELIVDDSERGETGRLRKNPP
jgi:hypothetical protein